MDFSKVPGIVVECVPFFCCFQTWHDFDQRSWRECKEAATSAQRSSLQGVRLLGNDIHEGALSLCKKDAKTAGVLHMLDLSCQDCQEYHPPVVPSLVVTNPPWGERLTDSSRFLHFTVFLGFSLIFAPDIVLILDIVLIHDNVLIHDASCLKQ